MNYNPYYTYASVQQAIVPITCEQEARSYPVAPGCSVMFQDESSPYRFYVKIMGKSPLESPTFEKYHLVKDDLEASEPILTASKKEDIDLSVYALKEDLNPILTKINGILNDVGWMKDRLKKGDRHE